MGRDQNFLSLEQLRKMVGQPVWIESIDPLISHWEIVEYGDIDNVISFQDSKNELIFLVSGYGKTWRAYAYKKIDFDKWESCENCTTEGCATCVNHLCGLGDEPCAKCTATNLYKPLAFCPYCGRPMTPNARMHLEKRIAESALNR